MKTVVGLGNPGPEYDATRHNVGWWAVDRMAYDWGFGPFERSGRSLMVEGSVDAQPTRLLKPLTFMNRSGAVLHRLHLDPDFDPSRDLLVVVDDTALEVGRLRIRGGGGAGGHNGLKSVASALGTQDFARLRIGVGECPPGEDRSEWVLSEMDEEDERAVLELLPDVTEAARAWIQEGVDPAMNRFNR